MISSGSGCGPRPANAVVPVFVGIGRTTDVNRYLRGIAHDVVADVDLDPFSVDYRTVTGSQAAR